MIMELGNAIKSLRKELGFKQAEIAKRSDISVTALWNIENNLTFPSKGTIDRICAALGVPISYLLFYSITDTDVPESKRQTFHYLQVSFKSFLLEK